MSSYLEAFNGSKIAWGLSTIGMQLGARFVVGDLTAMQTKILGSKVAKRIIMFLMIFVATRDVMISVVLTVAIHAVLTWLVNEHSGMCLVSPGFVSGHHDQTEYEAALAIVQRYPAGHDKVKRKRARPPRLFPPMRTNTFA